jgi:succinylglutamate desuccinylase
MKTYKTEIAETFIIDSEVDGPTITIMGGLHGDEPSGVEIVNDLVKNGIELLRGRIKLVIGNIQAVAENKRYIDKDANRLFAGGEQFSETSDYKRVQEIKQFMSEFGGTDVLLDIHNIRTKPVEGKPQSFVVCPNPEHSEGIPVLQALGIADVLTGKALFGADNNPVYSDTFAASIGALGVTLEGGYMKEPQTELIKKSILNVLAHYDMIDSCKVKNPKPNIINAHTSVMAGNNFSFSKTYTTWDEIPAHTLFGTDDDGEYSTGDKAAVIIFPKGADMIKAGEEVCILAESS